MRWWMKIRKVRRSSEKRKFHFESSRLRARRWDRFIGDVFSGWANRELRWSSLFVLWGQNIWVAVLESEVSDLSRSAEDSVILLLRWGYLIEVLL